MGYVVLCELNYMFQQGDVLLDLVKVVLINEQFQQSCQFWFFFVEKGVFDVLFMFINVMLYMMFVWGEKDVVYFKNCYEVFKEQFLFVGIEYSEDFCVINKWVLLLMQQWCKGELFVVMCVFVGMDVDFGVLIYQLFDYFWKLGVLVWMNYEVKLFKCQKDGFWLVKYCMMIGCMLNDICVKFVFVGVGGWVLKFLQNVGIFEIKGYGVFLIGGQFLKIIDFQIVVQYKVKVYLQVLVGVLFMLVLYFDICVVDGEVFFMFGLFVMFSLKFFKNGLMFDIVFQVWVYNLLLMLQVVVKNFDFIMYLISELLKNYVKKVDSLCMFMLMVKDEDWMLINVGQCVQVMKKDFKKGGVLQFGIEVVVVVDGLIVGLFGVLFGVFIVVLIMFDLLKCCFLDEYFGWEFEFCVLILIFGKKFNEDLVFVEQLIEVIVVVFGINV